MLWEQKKKPNKGKPSIHILGTFFLCAYNFIFFLIMDVILEENPNIENEKTFEYTRTDIKYSSFVHYSFCVVIRGAM